MCLCRIINGNQISDEFLGHPTEECCRKCQFTAIQYKMMLKIDCKWRRCFDTTFLFQFRFVFFVFSGFSFSVYCVFPTSYNYTYQSGFRCARVCVCVCFGYVIVFVCNVLWSLSEQRLWVCVSFDYSTFFLLRFNSNLATPKKMKPA